MLVNWKCFAQYFFSVRQFDVYSRNFPKKYLTFPKPSLDNPEILFNL